MRRKRSRHPLLVVAADRAAATGASLARRIGRVVVDRAIKQSVSSLRRQPPADARLLQDIGVGPADVELLAGRPQVLAADPFQISLKPNRRSKTPKPRSQ